MHYLFFLVFFFFFQAEDGIRDHCVTGVQTCALPISDRTSKRSTRPRQGSRVGPPRRRASRCRPRRSREDVATRSEERRVGKECRSRWWTDHEKKKKKKVETRRLRE